jgi:hypothetical protein
MATEGTKFQVNFKLADGTLINVYAADATELETGLAAIQDTSALIASVSGALGNAGAIRTVVAGLGATPVAAPAQSSVIEEGHCKHGKLVYRTSKPGAAKEWKGWFCPSPQGTPDQCAPKFLR